MTATVTRQQAKSEIDTLLDRVIHSAHEVVTYDEGRPIAKLIPIRQPKAIRRLPGSDKGRLVVPDEFNDPLPKEIESTFYK
jgi:antitoxin (DNA-binding transcriptional repressor) of toxin-antitoxin stability system